MRIISTLSICLFTIVTSAQIKEIKTEKSTKIGQINIGGMFFMDCQLYNDNLYVFNFRDLKYQKIVEIKSFSFKNLQNDFDKFYMLISKGISTKDESEKSIKLPDGTVVLNFKKKKVSFHFVDENGSIGISQYFNQKQIDNLFDKNNNN